MGEEACQIHNGESNQSDLEGDYRLLRTVALIGLFEGYTDVRRMFAPDFLKIAGTTAGVEEKSCVIRCSRVTQRNVKIRRRK